MFRQIAGRVVVQSNCATTAVRVVVQSICATTAVRVEVQSICATTAVRVVVQSICATTAVRVEGEGRDSKCCRAAARASNGQPVPDEPVGVGSVLLGHCPGALPEL